MNSSSEINIISEWNRDWWIWFSSTEGDIWINYIWWCGWNHCLMISFQHHIHFYFTSNINPTILTSSDNSLFTSHWWEYCNEFISQTIPTIQCQWLSDHSGIPLSFIRTIHLITYTTIHNHSRIDMMISKKYLDELNTILIEYISFHIQVIAKQCPNSKMMICRQSFDSLDTCGWYVYKVEYWLTV